jgi:hypothetical protein
LEDRFGEGADCILAGLVARFVGFPVHEISYYQSSISVQELRQRMENR